MTETNSAVTRRTAVAIFGGGLLAPALDSPVQGAETSEIDPGATDLAQAVSPRGFFFANPTFHFETLRNAGYIVSNCADLSEMLETVKIVSEGDIQSWYTAWEATADRVLALA